MSCLHNLTVCSHRTFIDHKGKNKLTSRYYLNEVINVNITSKGTNLHCLPQMDAMRRIKCHFYDIPAKNA